MLQKERHSLIVDMLKNSSSVTVNELSSLCSVSGETIRNDLKLLEGQKLLVRTHGGAVRSRDLPHYHPETPFYERESHNVIEKQEIASYAAQLLVREDQIILDASSTCVYLARSLPDFPLTLLTNSVRIVNETASNEKVEIISTGGILLRSSMCFVGRVALDILSSYHVSKAFLSCKGVDVSGASESNELAIAVKRKMMQVADETILLVDHTKFGVRDFLQVTDLDGISKIITDSRTTDEQIGCLGKYAELVTRCGG